MPKVKEFRKLLECEAQEGVTHYQVELNGQVQKPVASKPDGSLSTDLTGLSDGEHNVRIQAGCRWSSEHIQWSAWGPMDEFKIFRPAPPKGLHTAVREV